METLLQDIRYGARKLMKNPGFLIVAVITLALGIGANTAIFSMVDAFLLRPLPGKDPAQITVLAFQQKQGNFLTQFSLADYRDIRDQSTGVYFSSLGLQPALGRLILPSEGDVPGADPVMVLGYSYWQTRFGGDPGIIGRKVSVDGQPITIVGIAPKDFVGVYPILSVQGYLPMGMATIAGNPSDFMTNRQIRNVPILARLRAGA